MPMPSLAAATFACLLHARPCALIAAAALQATQDKLTLAQVQQALCDEAGAVAPPQWHELVQRALSVATGQQVSCTTETIHAHIYKVVARTFILKYTSDACFQSTAVQQYVMKRARWRRRSGTPSFSER